jgi:hypothetical protein
MRNRHRLEDFPTLPKSNYIPSIHGGNRLVEEELAYDQHSLIQTMQKIGSMMIGATHMKPF